MQVEQLGHLRVLGGGRASGADAGILEGGVTTGGGCGRGVCPLPREARKLLKSLDGLALHAK